MMRFSNGGFGKSEDHWFRIGTVNVDTTTFVAGLSALWFFVSAIEGPSESISKWLTFTSTEVLAGQLWRVATWPIVNAPGIMELLAVVLFFYFGSQIEGALGKVRMAWFLLALTITPALFLTLTDMISTIEGTEAGLGTLEFALLVAFVAYMPGVRFFFGIPGWVLVTAFLVLNVLGMLAFRDFYGLLFLSVIVGTALLAIRAFGLAEDLPWIPKLPLPASVGGDPYRSQAGGQVRKKKSKKSHLQAVNPLEEQIKQIEIDTILDQVSETGLDSLSKDQRKKLESYSKEQRKRNGS